MSDGGSVTKTIQLESIADPANDIEETISSRDTINENVQPVNSPTQSSSPAESIHTWHFFGTTITSNTLALIAGLFGIAMFVQGIISQRWTVRSDTLQNCLSLRQVGITTNACNDTIEQGVPSILRKRSLFEPAPTMSFGTTFLLGLCFPTLLLGLVYGYCRRPKLLNDVEHAIHAQTNASESRSFQPLVMKEDQNVAAIGTEFDSTDVAIVDKNHHTNDTRSLIANTGYEPGPSTSTLRQRGKAEFKCPECDAKFARYEELLRHSDSEHWSPPWQVSCKECSCWFDDEKELWKHCRETHGWTKMSNRHNHDDSRFHLIRAERPALTRRMMDSRDPFKAARIERLTPRVKDNIAWI